MSNISLFEISWEVCNKVGGIHTVLSSKLAHANSFAQNYIVFGPYKNTQEFNSLPLPPKFAEVKRKMEILGIILHYGEWKPYDYAVTCILVEIKGFEEQTYNIKARLWEEFEIDSLNTSWHDFDEVMVWSWACGILCEELAQVYLDNDVIVHSHEWISSGSTFYIASRKREEMRSNTNNSIIVKNIKNVFTTHATMLGRAYYGSFNTILNARNMDGKSGFEIAKELGVHTKYQTEYQAFRVSDVATCVSSMLKNEIAELYDYNNCVVTENGFERDLSFDDCIREFIEYHSKLTSSIQEYFKPYYDVKKNMRIGILSGRFEILAKGYDVIFKALGELNEELKQKEVLKDIVMLAPVIAGGFTQVNDSLQGVGFSSAPLSKHSIELNHPLMELATSNGLFNRVNDKVKIIFIPRMITDENKAFSMTYYQILQACDFSLYPSGYEPWGYTPHESIAYGVVTVTSKNAGFGQYWLESHINNSVVKSVIGEDTKSKVKEVKDYIIEEYFKKPSTQYREKKYALEYSKELQWNVLFENYKNIYEE